MNGFLTRSESNRIKDFPWCDEAFWFLLRAIDGHQFRVEFPGLPLDARLLGVAHDYTRRAFVLRFEHPSFDEVHPGSVVPIGDPVTVSVRPIPTNLDPNSAAAFLLDRLRWAVENLPAAYGVNDQAHAVWLRLRNVLDVFDRTEEAGS